jgi:ubiquinone/menaquinone biosynthesis C-methylase UbiE
MKILRWPVNPALLEGEEYLGNNILAENVARDGYDSIIRNYTYIYPEQVIEVLQLFPEAWNAMHGAGIDLGGGVGCISCAAASKPEVKKVYCLEVVEKCVTHCQPIIKKKVLGPQAEKVLSVIGDFDQLTLPNQSLDFAFSWDAIHHSMDPVKTLTEAHRVLKPGGHLIIVDRAYDNSTTDQEIERMLNIVYSKEFLRQNFRDENMTLTRRQNGEHEYRYREWFEFFKKAGFAEVFAGIAQSVDAPKNDAGIPEKRISFDMGAFRKEKVIFVAKKLHSQ